LEAIRMECGQSVCEAPSSSLPPSTTPAPTKPEVDSDSTLELTPNGGRVIDVWVHFGVDSKATEFRVESRAANGTLQRHIDMTS
jgi:hypothetical protein